MTTNDVQQVSGGDGLDEVLLSTSSGTTLLLDGVEFVVGGSGSDRLTVTDGTSVVIDGGLGNDTLVGGFGDDTLIGGSGDDVFVVDGGEDLIDGGLGQDTVDFSTSTSGVEVDLSLGTLIDGSGFEDQFSSIEGVVGSGFSDLLIGSSVSETLAGGFGDDTFVGGGGLDVLAGGSGEDVFEVDASLGGTIEGGSGTDTLSLVGISSDALVSGVEFVVGGSGSDRVLSLIHI